MNSISILGIPYDNASSFLKGCRLGPDAIRAAFNSSSSNRFSESETDLHGHPRLVDEGNIEFSAAANPIEVIENRACDILENGGRLLSLGGDHSVTYPLLKAHAAIHGPVNLLHFDAHPDLYDELDGNRFSHACPFARAHENELIDRHVQVGIRTMNSHQRGQADRFGVEVITMRDLPDLEFEFEEHVYVTVDLDVLDPAFVPGISHCEPGGMSTRELLRMIQGLRAPIIGADIVELNPTRDRNDMTAMVAAKLMKELLDKMLSEID